MAKWSPRVVVKLLLSDKAAELRERERALRVYVTRSERLAIQRTAQACAMTVSTYMRKVALNYEPESHLDRDVVRELLKGYADQRRLGGLLKLWLAERRDAGERVGRIEALLEELSEATRRAQAAATGASEAFEDLRHPSRMEMTQLLNGQG